MILQELIRIDKKDYKLLIKKYNDLQEIGNNFPSRFFKDIPHHFDGFDNKLPLEQKLNLMEWEFDSLEIPQEIMTENCYSKFLKLISDYAQPIYSQLDKLDLIAEDDYCD